MTEKQRATVSEQREIERTGEIDRERARARERERVVEEEEENRRVSQGVRERARAPRNDA